MPDQTPNADLIVHSTHPFNAEPPLHRLRQSFMTRASDHYIRSHGHMPDIDPTVYRLAVVGAVETALDLSLGDLQARCPAKTVTAVLQCAGNRRADLQQVEPTTGDPWQPGAIGNAAWTGAVLADVLRLAGVADDASLHVAFEALDIAENDGDEDAPFGVSIPLPKAMDGDVILAWAMNGAPLARVHGAPLRVIVPGYAGVRSAKWLAEIRVQEDPSAAFQQRKDYLLYPPDMRPETQDHAAGLTINQMPLNAAICDPEPGATFPSGDITIRGYAVASDRAIARIDVSTDGGQNWRQATIEDHANTRWSWRLWHIVVPLHAGTHELVVRAIDEAGQMQPALPADVWNYKGYLSAAWHRLRVVAF